MSDIETRVKTCIAEAMGIGLDTVTNTSRLEDDLAVDSLDEIEILMLIEEEFGIDLPDDAFDNLVTVNDVVERLKKYL